MEKIDEIVDTKPLPNTVYIFNMPEDVWPFIQAMSSEKARIREIEESADLGDRDLFSFCAEERMILILPKAIDAEFWAYYEKLMGKRDFRILVPKKHTGIISQDIMNDPEIVTELLRAANGQKRLVLKSYSTTQPFLDLVRFLRDKGLTVSTPDSPEEDDSWTVNFYGSKSGIRQLSQQSRAAEPDLIMPDGVIASGIIDASRIAANKYIKERGVVLKTNKGHSGEGVLLFKEGDLPTEFYECQQKILTILKEDAYWNLFPIVIETFITASPSIGGGCPNVEFRILKNGHVELSFYGGMRMAAEGSFRGMEINNDVVSDQVAARLVDTGFYIAEQYRAAGYRGYFDVDFVASRNGQVYVTESNVRRTGGTHVHDLAEYFFGKDYMYLTYILSNNSYDLPKGKTFTFSKLATRLEPVLFTKEKREGVVIISQNLLHYNLLAFVIFGANKKRAYEIEATMEALLQE